MVPPSDSELKRATKHARALAAEIKKMKDEYPVGSEKYVQGPVGSPGIDNDVPVVVRLSGLVRRARYSFLDFPIQIFALIMMFVIFWKIF